MQKRLNADAHLRSYVCKSVAVFYVIKEHLCGVGEVYSSHARSARLDIKMSDDVGDRSDDVQLKVFCLQVGRRVDDEHNVGLLTTLY